MTTLTKENVISQLETLLSAKDGKQVTVEQSGSWYKIDGGKSVRFSELEQMLAECVVVPAVKPPAKTAAKPAKKVKPASNGGKTPKEIWREKLSANPGNQLPRGF
ncbi:hypothetical protein PY479_13400 [Shewanella sp. A32]|uniref:hypothetical protein n=1 Tax=Shewanella sp. A32 TaxID=3031327 RepID=UPI0023B8E6DB|nr:hypothetical protein [Shewanella sp. A32]MDF0535267.1 hypothetical protein [Shewanella sp. A32]